MVGCLALAWRWDQRASAGTQKTFSAGLLSAPALPLRAACGRLSRSARLRLVHVVAPVAFGCLRFAPAVGGEPEVILCCAQAPQGGCAWKHCAAAPGGGLKADGGGAGVRAVGFSAGHGSGSLSGLAPKGTPVWPSSERRAMIRKRARLGKGSLAQVSPNSRESSWASERPTRNTARGWRQRRLKN